MLARIFVLTFLVVSQFSLALGEDQVIGDWCKWYDDFAEAYKIEANDAGEVTVETYTVGYGRENEPSYFGLKKAAGETHGRSSGYISFGANGTRLILDGEDTGVVEIKSGFDLLSQQKTLKLLFTNNFKIVLKQCRIQPRDLSATQ